jgi:poly-beta-hydroxyalkanoate depolymerase
MTLPVSFIHLDDLANIATAVAAVVTVLLLIAAVWAGKTAQAQIAEQRRIEMRRRAYDHLGVFNSREFTEMTSEAAAVLRLFKEEKAAHKAIWAKLSDADKTAVQTFLNFYEEIATEYNAGFLDREAAEPLVFVAIIMWQQSKELVEWLRRGESRYLEQWEKLYRNKAAAILSPKDSV